MTRIKQLWTVFASVQLAIFLLIFIATTSIIGTVIPQNEPFAFYVKKFGMQGATFLQLLDIPSMYSSWWFYSLLMLLSVNLIICSIDRFPAAWKILTFDNLSISQDRLLKMRYFHQWALSENQDKSLNIGQLASTLLGKRYIVTHANTTISFFQKGKLSRLGVYMVHISILVIFLGAIIGHLFGFKGTIMLPELKQTDQVFSTVNGTPLPLGFTVRCDAFNLQFYPNGMPKEYRSDLVVLENGQQKLQKSISVNTPLTYQGITFYQSSYLAHEEFIIQIIDNANLKTNKFPTPFQQQYHWTDNEMTFGIINAEGTGKQAVRAKLWLKMESEEPIIKWLKMSEPFDFTAGGKNYTLSVKQLYSTGLQVAKDPGVYVVYLGCGLLLVGLYLSFFISHQRLWLCKQHVDGKNILILAGSSNKNKQAFEKLFVKIQNQLDQILVH